MLPDILQTISKFAAPIGRSLAQTAPGAVLSAAKKVYKEKGLGEAISHVAKYSDVGHNLMKGQTEFLDFNADKASKVGKFFRSSIGNLAANVEVLTKDVAGSGVRAPVVAGKNLIELFGRNLREDFVKKIPTKSLKESKLVTRDGIKYYKGKRVWGETSLPNGVVNSDFEKQTIIDKTLPFKALSIAMSAPATGLYVATAQDQHNKVSIPKRIGSGFYNAAKWTIAPGPAVLMETSKAGVGLVKQLKTKNKLLVEESTNGIR